MNNKLYHYTSGKGLFGIINTSQLFCSQLSFMNDPSEHKHFDQVIRRLFKNNVDCKEIYDKLYNESYHGITYDFHDYYVLSLSRNNDSLSMWNYYANGNGYSVGLNYRSIIEKNMGKFGWIGKIELLYDETKQYGKLKRFIKSFKKELINEEKKVDSKSIELPEDLIRRFNSGLIGYRTSFKHPSYNREEEERLLIAKPITNEAEVNYRISDTGVAVEYIKLDIDVKTDIRSIMIHPLGTDLHEEGLKRFTWDINKSLKIERSTIPFREI